MSPLKVIAPEEMHFVAFWTMVGVFPIEIETKISKLIFWSTDKMNFCIQNCMPISKIAKKEVL